MSEAAPMDIRHIKNVKKNNPHTNHEKMQVSPANNSGPECWGWAKSLQNMQRKHAHNHEMNAGGGLS